MDEETDLTDELEAADCLEDQLDVLLDEDDDDEFADDDDLCEECHGDGYSWGQMCDLCQGTGRIQ